MKHTFEWVNNKKNRYLIQWEKYKHDVCITFQRFGVCKMYSCKKCSMLIEDTIIWWKIQEKNNIVKYYYYLK